MKNKVKKIFRTVTPRPAIQLIKKTIGLGAFHARSAFATELPTKNIRLHLGCGEIRLNGFINVDFLKTTTTDVISDITKLSDFKNGAVSLIYACQFVEHFSHDEVPKI